jgi:hypothetical protein
LSYRFGLPDFALAEKTMTNAVNKVRQLYAQQFEVHIFYFEFFKIVGQ